MQTTIPAAIECHKLVKRFADKIAVNELDLTVPTGSIFGLLGPNGSGKTSTIRTTLGIYVPDGGSVSLLGAADPLAVRHRVGYLRRSADSTHGCGLENSWRFSHPFADWTPKRRNGAPTIGSNASDCPPMPSR